MKLTFNAVMLAVCLRLFLLPSSARAQADVSATETGAATVLAGSNISYTVSITNLGPATAANVLVSDTLPVNAIYVSSNGRGVLNGGVVTWPTIASLGSGQMVAFQVIVTAPVSGSLTNVVSSTSTTSDPTAANNNGTRPAAIVITTVTPSADVSVTETGPADVPSASTITYTVSITNLGPSTASNVSVADVLPGNAGFVSATAGGVYNGVVVIWPLIGSLTNGQAISYQVMVTAPVSGIMTNVVLSTSTTSDPNPGNNSGAIVVTTVSALISSPPTLGFIVQNHHLVLSWPTNAVGFVLEWSTNQALTNWAPVSPLPVIVGGQYTLTNTMSGGKMFYQLKKT